MASSAIYTHSHNNIDVLKNFSESSDGEVLYKGELLTSESDTGYIDTHITSSVYSSSGVHNLRYYNSRLEYYHNNRWNEIETGGGTVVNVDKDIIISPVADNALVKYSSGYYVQGFLISKQSNNALVKYSDGYYVPKIPLNVATTTELNQVVEDINQDLTEQEQYFNERYDLIVEKLQLISSSIINFKQHEFTGYNLISDLVVDISTLYNISKNVIMNLEIMIVNTSDTDMLTIRILENDITTLNDTLLKSETQRYKLPNITQFKIYIQGNFKLYVYVNYI